MSTPAEELADLGVGQLVAFEGPLDLDPDEKLELFVASTKPNGIVILKMYWMGVFMQEIIAKPGEDGRVVWARQP